MNALTKFISENGLTEVVSESVYDLKTKDWKVVGSYSRVLHNTLLTDQPIFIKHFIKYDNIMLSVNDTELHKWFYINQYDKDWVEVQEFIDSLENLKSKPASLNVSRTIEV